MLTSASSSGRGRKELKRAGSRLVASVESKSLVRKSSRWAAWLDVLQGVSGLVLLLFIWTHMIMVSSILISKDAMFVVSRMFEGVYVFDEPHPVLVSMVAVVIFCLLVIHGIIALRKAPSSYREYRQFITHANRFKHTDTNLWLLQVITGFILMFLATAHIYQMFSQPGNIGPYASADRIWTNTVWPLYLVLLFAVELHGGVGLYRWLLKWGWFGLANNRQQLKVAKSAITGFFLILGLLTLAAYIKLGIEHENHAGERYRPVSFMQQMENP
ncbi:MAG: fumarate reductase cytochrome b subunit [Gammaproteobacteria bacterium]|nr:fumarate reductase cytochrome b subunit [Gammaproteobacteria bacterium]